MFKFLKEKLSNAISRFSSKAEDEADDVEEEIPIEEAVREPEAAEEPEVPKEEKLEDEPEPEEEPGEEPEAAEDEKTEDGPELVTEEPGGPAKVAGPEPGESGLHAKATKGPEHVNAADEIPEELVEEAAEEDVGISGPADAAGPEEKPDPGEAEPEIPETQEPEKKGFFSKIRQTFTKQKEAPDEIKAEQPAIPGKQALFAKLREKVSKKQISEAKFNDLFWELELALMENNVAVEVVDKIKEDLKASLVDRPIARRDIPGAIAKSLKQSIASLINEDSIDLEARIKEKKPYVICFVGINGSGKTTTIAKVCHMLKARGHSCVLAAADTFRAAAIDQLQLHADKLNVKLIKHNYGSDAAAVAFDAVKHAEAKGIDVVLIDTAGRMQSNTNLMDEMKKVVRVAKPDLKVFVGESITGNDCVEQAKKFDEAIGIDAVILSKADVDEKGGAAVSVSYVTKKPIIYIGVGQGYSDLKPFESGIVLDNLGLA
ncbi:MAG: signal recognition particle-docking protein FtsY [archaeon]